jgi:hypothetical protein
MSRGRVEKERQEGAIELEREGADINRIEKEEERKGGDTDTWRRNLGDEEGCRKGGGG